MVPTKTVALWSGIVQTGADGKAVVRLPVGIGFLWGSWVSASGAFLIAGVARVVVLQHCTFCINSLYHYLGTRPYSSRCSK